MMRLVSRRQAHLPHNRAIPLIGMNKIKPRIRLDKDDAGMTISERVLKRVNRALPISQHPMQISQTRLWNIFVNRLFLANAYREAQHRVVAVWTRGKSPCRRSVLVSLAEIGFHHLVRSLVRFP